jgi:hypothetical protein
LESWSSSNYEDSVKGFEPSTSEDAFVSEVNTLKWTCFSYHPIPWRDSISRPITSVSSVVGGNDTVASLIYIHTYYTFVLQFLIKAKLKGPCPFYYKDRTENRGFESPRARVGRFLGIGNFQGTTYVQVYGVICNLVRIVIV